MKLSDKTYEVLKWVAMVALDALGLCYKTLAGIWGFPYGDEVLATCSVVSLLLGALIGISTASYRKDEENA